MARSTMFRQTLRLLRAAVTAERERMGGRAVREALERETELSRRKFLTASLQTASLLPLAGLLPLAHSAEKPRPLARRTSSDPILILGAGVAGLVAAHRLQQAGQPVELYEGSGRIGGRVFTKDRFNSDGMFCELGGELIDTDHHDVLDLCKELRLPVEDLRPFDAGVEQDIFHFGGRITTQKEMIPAFRPLARRVARDIAAVFPKGNVHMPVYDDPAIDMAAARKFDAMSLKDYLYASTDVDHWVLEAIEVLYVCEYGADAADQSALNLLVLLQPEQKPGEFNLLGKSDECIRVRGGNSRLVEALAARVRRQAPPVHLRHKLVRVADSRGKLELTFEVDGGARKTVRAARVVSAIPFTTLRKVEGLDELGLTALKKKCIHELGYGANTKFMVGFKERLWRKPGNAPASRMNLVNDALNQSYWETSKGQRGKSGILTNYLGGSRVRDLRSAAQRVPTVLAEMEKLYPGMSDAHDGNTALFQWGSYELNLGSYVSPTPGQYTTLWGAAAAPELDGRLYFTGEHTSSDGAGFINGAVQSGNQVAQQILVHQRQGSLKKAGSAS
ncbi:MAG: FAD-dependent oxidoreductase [Deltaproteobacteria bacterium]|nr:FAD-dependent oxidoreductase [Deltaproteobacteria bacterium]